MATGGGSGSAGNAVHWQTVVSSGLAAALTHVKPEHAGQLIKRINNQDDAWIRKLHSEMSATTIQKYITLYPAFGDRLVKAGINTIPGGGGVGDQ